MFPDVAKLDRAQTRPDALVPVDTKGGTRKIGDGIYSFQTPELRGTIDLINWMNDVTGRNVGVTDLAKVRSSPCRRRPPWSSQSS